MILEEYNWHQKKKLLKVESWFIWDDHHLSKIGTDGLLRRCNFCEQIKDFLWHYHNSSYGGYYNG